MNLLFASTSTNILMIGSLLLFIAFIAVLLVFAIRSWGVTKASFKSIFKGWVTFTFVALLFMVTATLVSGSMMANGRTHSGWLEATHEGQMQMTSINDASAHNDKKANSSIDKLYSYVHDQGSDIETWWTSNELPEAKEYLIDYYNLSTYDFAFTATLEDGTKVQSVDLVELVPASFFVLLESALDVNVGWIATDLEAKTVFLAYLFDELDVFPTLYQYASLYGSQIDGTTYTEAGYDYWIEQTIKYQNSTTIYLLDMMTSSIREYSVANNGIQIPNYSYDPLTGEMELTGNSHDQDYSNMYFEFNPGFVLRYQDQLEHLNRVTKFYRMDQFESDQSVNKTNRLIIGEGNLPTGELAYDPRSNTVTIQVAIFEKYAEENDLELGKTYSIGQTKTPGVACDTTICINFAGGKDILDSTVAALEKIPSNSAVIDSIKNDNEGDPAIIDQMLSINIDYNIAGYVYMPNYQYPLLSYQEILTNFKLYTIAIVDYDVYNFFLTNILLNSEFSSTPDSFGFDSQIIYTDIANEEAKDGSVNKDHQELIDQRSLDLNMLLTHYVLTKDESGNVSWNYSVEDIATLEKGDHFTNGDTPINTTSHWIDWISSLRNTVFESIDSFASGKISYSYNDSTFGLNLRFFQPEVNMKFMLIFSVVLALIFTVIDGIVIFIVIRKKIHDDMPKLGVLKALGYKRGEIAIGYGGYPIFVALIGGVAGLIGGLFAQSIWISRTFANFMAINFGMASIGLPVLTISIFLPLVVLTIFALVLTMVILKKDVIAMVNNVDNVKPNALVKLTGKVTQKSSFAFSYATKNGVRALGKSMLLFVTIFGVTFFISFAATGRNLAGNAISQTTETFQVSSMSFFDPTLPVTAIREWKVPNTYEYEVYEVNAPKASIDSAWAPNPLGGDVLLAKGQGNPNNDYVDWTLTEGGNEYVYTFGLDSNQLTAIENGDESALGKDYATYTNGTWHIDATTDSWNDDAAKLYAYMSTTLVEDKYFIPSYLINFLSSALAGSDLTWSQNRIEIYKSYNNYWAGKPNPNDPVPIERQAMAVADMWRAMYGAVYYANYIGNKFGYTQEYLSLGKAVQGWDEQFILNVVYYFDLENPSNAEYKPKLGEKYASLPVFSGDPVEMKNYIHLQSASGVVNNSYENLKKDSIKFANQLYDETTSGNLSYTPNVPVVVDEVTAYQMNFDVGDTIYGGYDMNFQTWPSEMKAYYEIAFDYYTVNHASEPLGKVEGNIYLVDPRVITYATDNFDSSENEYTFKEFAMNEFSVEIPQRWYPSFNYYISDIVSSYYVIGGFSFYNAYNDVVKTGPPTSTDYDYVISNLVQPRTVSLKMNGFDQHGGINYSFTSVGSQDWISEPIDERKLLTDNGSFIMMGPAMGLNFEFSKIYNSISEGLEMFQVVINYFIIFALLIALMMIFIVIFEIISSTRKEAATLKALGYSNGKTSFLVVIPYAIIMFLAFLVAIPINIVIYKLIVYLVLTFTGSNIPLMPSWLTYGYISIFVLMIFAVTISACAIMFKQIHPTRAMAGE